MKIVGNKIYDVCPECGEIVQINKPIFGSMHYCRPLEGTKEDIDYYRKITIPKIKEELEGSDIAT